MCRLTAVLSTRRPVCVGDIVTKPRLSIIYQSFNCHERLPRDRPRWAYEQSTLNGDGFGVGWYIPREQSHLVVEAKRPCVFTSLKPAWGDRNLSQLAEMTVSPLIFAHVRAAGPGSGNPTETNCHPFRYGRFLFMHNGLLGEFARVRRPLLTRLKTAGAFNYAMETTPIDSVVIFALFIDLLDRGPYAEYSANELRAKMHQVLGVVKAVLDEYRVEDVTYANCVVSDGCHLVATRYAVGPYSKRFPQTILEDEAASEEEQDRTQSLSLYFASGTRWVDQGNGDYRMTHTDKRNEVCIVTSEPLTEAREEWVPVPHNHLVVVSANCDVLLQPITGAARPPTWDILDGLDTHKRTIFRSLESLTAAASSPFASPVTITESPPRHQDRQADPPSAVACRRMLRSGGEPTLCLCVAEARVGGSAAKRRLLFTGDQEGCIHVWAMDANIRLATLRGHRGAVLALQAYSQQPGKRSVSSLSDSDADELEFRQDDTCWLFSASADTTVGVWDVAALLATPQAELPTKNPADFLAIRLYFEPLQGDVLSLAVVRGKDDFLYIGYQSTLIGYVRLRTLFSRIRGCCHFKRTHVSACSETCAQGECSIGKHMTTDFLGAAQLVLSATSQLQLPDPSESVFAPPNLVPSDTPRLSDGGETVARFLAGVPAKEGFSDVSSRSSSRKLKGDCNCSLDWYLSSQVGVDHHCGFVECLSVSGDYLISGGGDGLVMVWKANQHVATLSGHTGGVLCLATDSEPAFYSGSRDRSIRVWDLNTFACKQVLRAHTSDVMALTLTSKFLISASTAHEIYGWSRRWHDISFVFSSDDLAPGVRNSLSVAALSVWWDKDVVMSAGGDGIVRFWDVEAMADDGTQIERQSTVDPGDSKSPLSLDTTATWLTGATSLATAEHLLRQLVPIRSISGQPTFLNECWRAAKMITACLDELGAETKLWPTGPDSAPIVVGRLGSDPRKPTVVLYSHYDVVPSGDHYDSTRLPCCTLPSSPPKHSVKDSHWLTDPWNLTVVNGFFCGRGATDNKGPLIAQILAVNDLRRGNYDTDQYKHAFSDHADFTPFTGLPVNVVFVSEGEEENGSVGFAAFLQENLQSLKDAQYAIFTNTYWLDDERPCLVHGMRGVIDLQVTVTGGEDPLGLHSGIHGGAVVEPLADLLALTGSLVDAQGHVSVPGFYDDVVPHDEQPSHVECDALQSAYSSPTRQTCFDLFDVDKYRKETGYAGLRNVEPRELLRRRWLQPALSLTEIWSSTQTSGDHVGSNFRILPSKVGCNISVRFVPNQKASFLVDKLKECLEFEFSRRRSPNKLEITLLKCHDWWQGDTSSPLFHAAARAMTAVWKTEPLCTREGGTIPVIQQIQDKLGLATIQLPVGQASDSAHLPNEKLKCTNLENGIEVLKMTLWALGAVHAGIGGTGGLRPTCTDGTMTRHPAEGE